MEGLIFPIIMLAVTLLGGGLLLIVLKHSKPKHKGGGESLAIQTAQEFINVRDIQDRYLYTTDGMLLTFVRLHSISIDLYSRAEKNSLIRQLTAELSDIQYPFKFLAVSRPVDISPVITDMQSMLKEADDRRKELLRQEILQMSGFALSGEIVERQFYVDAICGEECPETQQENQTCGSFTLVKNIKPFLIVRNVRKDFHLSQQDKEKALQAEAFTDRYYLSCLYLWTGAGFSLMPP